MPVVCENCGGSNRSKAKFCVGCARPLPGFSPSGPGALDAMMAFRPSFDAPERTGAAGARTRPVPVLPAETAAFWLKAGCVGLVMLLAFAVWCFQVTRRPGAPPLRAEVLSMLAPAPGPAEAPPAAAVPNAVAAVAPAATEPPAQRQAPIAALLPAPPQAAAEPPIARTPPDAATHRTAARAASRPSSSRRERIDASASAAAVVPDPGPPIAIGPGPEYTYPRRALPAAGSDGALPGGPPARDLGPPIAPGPGPQYDYSRLPVVRAPSWSSNDPGPPIAVGPGPSVNYLPRGGGR